MIRQSTGVVAARRAGLVIGDNERVNDSSGLAKPGDSYASRIPYVVPDSLDDLTGPASGVIELPRGIEPTGRRYDLDDPSSRVSLYVRVISDATTTEDLTTYLNRDMLRWLWPQLHLPRYCVRRWHERFPELAAIGAGGPWQ
jgi:hypothetical protein